MPRSCIIGYTTFPLLEYFFQVTLLCCRMPLTPILRSSLMFITGIHAFSETTLKANLPVLYKPSAAVSILRQERIFVTSNYHSRSILCYNPFRATFVPSRLQMSSTSDTKSPQRRKAGSGGQQRREGGSPTWNPRGGGGASSPRTIDEAWTHTDLCSPRILDRVLSRLSLCFGLLPCHSLSPVCPSMLGCPHLANFVHSTCCIAKCLLAACSKPIQTNFLSFCRLRRHSGTGKR